MNAILLLSVALALTPPTTSDSERSPGREMRERPKYELPMPIGSVREETWYTLSSPTRAWYVLHDEDDHRLACYAEIGHTGPNCLPRVGVSSAHYLGHGFAFLVAVEWRIGRYAAPLSLCWFPTEAFELRISLDLLRLTVEPEVRIAL
jgi:hypothetical protein